MSSWRSLQIMKLATPLSFAIGPQNQLRSDSNLSERADFGKRQIPTVLKQYFNKLTQHFLFFIYESAGGHARITKRSRSLVFRFSKVRKNKRKKQNEHTHKNNMCQSGLAKNKPPAQFWSARFPIERVHLVVHLAWSLVLWLDMRACRTDGSVVDLFRMRCLNLDKLKNTTPSLTVYNHIKLTIAVNQIQLLFSSTTPNTHRNRN